MKAIVLVGGDQTRFGKTFAEQPKVLIELPGGQTLLSNILTQLNSTNINQIILAVRDKEILADYAQGLNIGKPPLIDRREHNGIGEYFFISSDYLPATYIFGDIYFPNNILTYYFEKIAATSNGFDVIIGICRRHVGDYGVKIEGDAVIEISKVMEAEFWTCGVFTFLNKDILSAINKTDKLTDIVRQLCHTKHKIGYVILEEELIDLDTEDKIKELPTNL